MFLRKLWYDLPMDEKAVKGRVKYWQETAGHDFETMLGLFRIKRYPDSLLRPYYLRARYPDAKLNFYKLCTYGYTKENIDKIKKLYKKLCQELKPKK